eukprot:354972-Chlamydomonas_euryale.AAC.1
MASTHFTPGPPPPLPHTHLGQRTDRREVEAAGAIAPAPIGPRVVEGVAVAAAASTAAAAGAPAAAATAGATAAFGAAATVPAAAVVPAMHASLTAAAGAAAAAAVISAAAGAVRAVVIYTPATAADAGSAIGCEAPRAARLAAVLRQTAPPPPPTPGVREQDGPTRRTRLGHAGSGFLRMSFAEASFGGGARLRMHAHSQQAGCMTRSCARRGGRG